MIDKLKNEIHRIKWPDRKTVLRDLKIVVIGTIVLLLVITAIDNLTLLGLKALV